MRTLKSLRQKALKLITSVTMHALLFKSTKISNLY